MKTAKITFRTTKEFKAEISQFAKLQGVSSGQLIRNWINVFLKNQIVNSAKHVYELQNGIQFPDMKSLCENLQISSRTARKRVKNGVIKKITQNPYQTQQYGEEIRTANSRGTERNRIQV